jgi:hypothetical protein
MAVLPYLRVITQGYFLADDFGLIQLYRGKSARDFLPLFAGDWAMGIFGVNQQEIRPLVGLSYKTDYALWGVNARGFHASNVLWHALNVVLLFFISYLLTGKDRMTALLSAALFAAVPVHAGAVSWIAGRGDLIYGFFWLASVLCLICFLRSDSTWAYVASVVFFTAGLFTKEPVVVLPAVLAACVLFYRSPRRTARVGAGPLLAPFLLVLALYLLLRYIAFGNPLSTYEPMSPVSLRYLPFMLAGLVVPMIRDLWQQEVWVLALLTSAASGLLVVLFCVRVYRERRALASAWPLVLLGCAWYSIALLPSAVTGGREDRYLYVPSAGLCLAAAPVLVALCRRRSGARRAAAGLCIVLFLLINAGVLVSMNETWVRAGRASRRLELDFSRLAGSVPRGSFVVFLNPPVAARRTYVWEGALPFAFQEPFSPVYRDLVIVETPEVYCCPTEDWWRRTRALFQDLLTRPSPVYLAFWDEGQGRLRTAAVNQEALACFRQPARDMRFTPATALSLVPSLIAVPPKCPAGPTGTPPVR